MTVGELLLPMYEFFCILKTLIFGDHFCGSFGKPNNRAICVSLFYMYFLHCSLVYFSAMRLCSFTSRNLMGLIARMRKMIYMIIIGLMFVLNQILLMCHLILGG